MLLTLFAAAVLQTGAKQTEAQAPKFEVVFEAKTTLHGIAASRDQKALFLKAEQQLLSIDPVQGKVLWELRVGPSQMGSVTDEPRPALLAVTKDCVVVGNNVTMPSVKFYSVESGAVEQSFGSVAMGKKAACIAADSKGKWVWFGLTDGKLARSTVSDVNAWSKRDLKTSSLTCMSVDPKEKNVALGGKDGSVRFVGMSSASIDKKKVFEAEVGAITSIAYGPKGKHLFVGGSGGEVTDMTIAKGASKNRLKGPASPVTDIVVPPKSKWAAVSYKDGSIYIFNLKKGEVLHKLTHPDAQYGVVDLDLIGKSGTLLSAGGNTVVSWTLPD